MPQGPKLITPDDSLPFLRRSLIKILRVPLLNRIWAFHYPTLLTPAFSRGPFPASFTHTPARAYVCIGRSFRGSSCETSAAFLYFLQCSGTLLPCNFSEKKAEKKTGQVDLHATAVTAKRISNIYIFARGINCTYTFEQIYRLLFHLSLYLPWKKC